ncbi:uncharacterized protein METZ01_LOCUS391548, partial [marine metagenome]
MSGALATGFLGGLGSAAAGEALKQKEK